MKRALPWLATGSVLLSAACVKPPAPGEPVRGLTQAQRDQFDRGKAVFTRVFTPETGLGPLFNAPACGECHERPDCEGVVLLPGVTGKDWPNVEYRFRTGEVSVAPGVWGPWLRSRIEQALN